MNTPPIAEYHRQLALHQSLNIIGHIGQYRSTNRRLASAISFHQSQISIGQYRSTNRRLASASIVPPIAD
ncbi:hypothetical protein BLNAU_19734 [Blattamonas nauphoetae]|uniref:Uncharacterized protein n=1 Tax=Blattamonas nauphoetae TaxID=2049346 RepID=A0ABQ9X0X2_9EUKA|nr:hypothetical protein BLNAU_19734 [Blattamonas nauphoetae]